MKIPGDIIIAETLKIRNHKCNHVPEPKEYDLQQFINSEKVIPVVSDTGTVRFRYRPFGPGYV